MTAIAKVLAWAFILAGPVITVIVASYGGQSIIDSVVVAGMIWTIPCGLMSLGALSIDS